MNRFEHIINSAVKEAMSDIHITGEHPVVSRKNGDIRFHGAMKWTHKEIDDLTTKILTPPQLERLRQRKSIDISFSIGNARLRINFFTTVRGISMAIRILPGRIPTIDDLNLHPSLHDISKIKSGLVLVCGSTGVGKTTTIAAIINDINTSRQAHIVTLEDPIEYRFQSKKSFIEQRELGPQMPSFEQGLIDVLREDSDVIVVGELREGKTMQIALNAAESGHLVIATLHASNPEDAVYRLCNAVPMDAQNEVRNQIASTLNLLIVQQLIYMEKADQRVPLLTIVRGTQPIKNIIRDNKLHHLENATIQSTKEEGMFSSDRYLTEYLETRSSFSPYSKNFHPLEEVPKNVFYQSPLTEDIQQTKQTTKQHNRRKTDIKPKGLEYSNEDFESVLKIDDDVSLHKFVENINKDRG